ncbi:MAG: amylo-alpha-1,6-glucosidase, partial [Chloroflexota bacterium]
SRLARMLGNEEGATRLNREAEQLRKRFESAFWSNQLNCYAEAIDGDHRPCLVLTSNPGHCLYAGLVSDKRAGILAEQLMSPEVFSGWGVRTLASNSIRYNPMSYHNGSVWPHDNAIIAAGLARYGHKREALQILTGLFNASHYLDLRRMPELFCGFDRQPGAGPTLYPVACLPQAWAAGAVFMILGACLGLEIDAPKRQLRIVNPVLPEYLDDLTITDLQVGDVVVDLVFHRYERDTSVNVLRRSGKLEVMILK